MKNTELQTFEFLKEYDLVCFSHLRWSHVFQRPQHLLTRFAKHTRVLYIEEPDYHDSPDELNVNHTGNLYVITPLLDKNDRYSALERQQQMIRGLFSVMHVEKFILWFYTPMALPLIENMELSCIVYDCMDELASFKNAPMELKTRERQLLSICDIVFTGGRSIFEAKKNRHHNIYCFPSSIDKHHFAMAREIRTDPADQQPIAHPRFGFAGVIDERMDLGLIFEVASRKPEWHFIIIGPVAKISPSALPRLQNIHYLGQKTYHQLPHYMSGWDVAMIPFALNEHTRYISPTKTPEYLAGGKPVISTPIKDIVSPYGEKGLVHIAYTPAEFIVQADKILNQGTNAGWLQKVDDFLAANSWDDTWQNMTELVERIVYEKQEPDTKACA